jgi:hypothetical protein
MEAQERFCCNDAMLTSMAGDIVSGIHNLASILWYGRRDERAEFACPFHDNRHMPYERRLWSSTQLQWLPMLRVPVASDSPGRQLSRGEYSPWEGNSTAFLDRQCCLPQGVHVTRNRAGLRRPWCWNS